MKTYKIHLIRQGLTQEELDGIYIGRKAVTLSENGKKELAALREGYDYPEVDTVISSPAIRCLQTARILYPGHNPQTFDELDEFDFGEFEGKTAKELKDNKDFINWVMGGKTAGCPYGETNDEFGERVDRVFSSIVWGLLKDGDVRSVALITHGGVIMRIMQDFALPQLPMHEWITPCGCGFTLNVIPEIWTSVMKTEMFGEIPSGNSDGFYSEDSEIFELSDEELKGFFDPEKETKE